MIKKSQSQLHRVNTMLECPIIKIEVEEINYSTKQVKITNSPLEVIL